MIPDYLTLFYRRGDKPFRSICDLEEAVAAEILRHDILWRGDGTYLTHRKRHEQYIREQFIGRGGRPTRKFPIYMILGDSPEGPHSLDREYEQSLKLPLKFFHWTSVTFTYPDSLYIVPLDDLGRIHLDRNDKPRVLLMKELEQVIQTYRVYEYNNHYIEAQVWDDEPVRRYCSETGLVF